jgi:hypothetical protein
MTPTTGSAILIDEATNGTVGAVPVDGNGPPGGVGSQPPPVTVVVSDAPEAWVALKPPERE